MFHDYLKNQKTLYGDNTFILYIECLKKGLDI